MGTAPPSSGLPIRSRDGPTTESVPSNEGPEYFTQSHASPSVVTDYHRFLAEDPDLTMPIAALLALIGQLKKNATSTAMETVEIVNNQANILRNSLANPIPAQAGADILKAVLNKSLRRPEGSGHKPKDPTSSSADNFSQTRQHLLANGPAFIQRVKDDRAAIADRGTAEIIPETTIMTAGASRAVRDVFLSAAKKQTASYGHPRFKVVYVADEQFRDETDPVIEALREKGIFVAEIDYRSVASVLHIDKRPSMRVSKIVVGAEALTHDGNLISRMGTYQLAELAKAANIDFVVFAETYKVVLVQTIGNMDLERVGVSQGILDYRSSKHQLLKPSGKAVVAVRDRVDWTPKKLITRIVTERKTMSANECYSVILEQK